LHYDRISIPRATAIADAIVKLAPSGDSILDVGCGDGLLLQEVARRIGAREVHGIDVKIQPNLAFEASKYDGLTIPFDTAKFDVVTISDVLHHATDADATLREAIRVVKPTGAVIIKDHFCFGPWSHGVLLAMDVVGNLAQGIDVTGKYLSPSQWVDLVRRCGGSIEQLQWPLRIHSLPFRLVARSAYQFTARVVRAR
jgi:2-polyprenyl-3-methyl-5-hydroxy-6-metoxy-1,4-benzoquinol methylase